MAKRRLPDYNESVESNSERVSNVKVAVIGGGSWGTGFAWLLGEAGRRVSLWAREPEIVRGINENRRNPLFNTEAFLAPGVSATESMGDALEGASIAAVAVPSKFLYEVIESLKPAWQTGCIYLCLTKGLCGEPADFVSGFVKSAWPILGAEKFAILGGPNLAGEIVQGYPTAAVVASESAKTAESVRAAASGNTFRIYTSGDVLGVEIGGAVKNIIAIAAGMLDGLGFGVNARSVLITRGLVEMTRLAEKLGAKRETLMGLSGLGDLVTTCSSPNSRNFTVGRRLAGGETLAEITASMKMIAEGVTTTAAIVKLARGYGIEMPIAEQVQAVLESGKPIKDAILELMTRLPKAE